MAYSTVESDLEIEIEAGSRNLPIHVRDIGANGLPAWPPQETAITEEDVLFKFNITNSHGFSAGPHLPHRMTLSLFLPKDQRTDLTPLYDPPSYAGHGGNGDYLLSVAGNTAVPRKEDTPLFNDYIAPNWDLVSGQHFEIDWNENALEAEEAANTDWPGGRSQHTWRAVEVDGFLLTSGTVTLRVTSPNVWVGGQLFLLLLEVMRPHRIRLMARTVLVVPPVPESITNNCPASAVFLGAAAYGSQVAPQLTVLRRWRDQGLSTNRLGRALVRTYYRFSAPVAAAITRHSGLQRASRMMLNPLIGLLDRRYPGHGRQDAGTPG